MVGATALETTAAVRSMLPRGLSLDLGAWRRRHHGILLLLAAHAAGLAAFGLYMGAGLFHSLSEGAAVGAFAIVAAWPRLKRRVRSVIASAGLMSASAVLVHLSGGYIESHFHFFVMLGVIFLYEDWVPYVIAVVYVAVHHGIAGTIDPLSVYNHPSALAQPWTWAGIHALFILGLSAALVVAWNAVESARRSANRAQGEAEDVKRQLHAQEKMAALGSLVAGLAHEVRTPLTVVATSASLIELQARRTQEPAGAQRILEQTREIQLNVERIKGLVAQLRRFHGLAPDERRETTLDSVVKEAVALLLSVNRSRAALELDLQETRATRLDPLGVQQIVLNLVANAFQAVDPSTGVVKVRTRDEGDRVLLVVEDNGQGIPYESQAKVFDPLFTTKPDGMGLGLHIVKRIVDAHRGEISLTSAPGKGTIFSISFPLVGSPPPPAALPGVGVPAA